MKKNITRALIAGLFTLASASAFASGALTAFSSTNNTVGGVGNVTITFTITDANFGAPPNGGWYLALQLPAGMTTGSTYATDANCAVNAVYFSPPPAAPATTPRCGLSAGGGLYVANTNPGAATTVGSGTYTITIQNVTNPNAAGTYTLQSFNYYNTSNTTTAITGLNTFGITIGAAAAPASSIPTLSEYGMAMLASLMALVFFKRKKGAAISR